MESYPNSEEWPKMKEKLEKIFQAHPAKYWKDKVNINQLIIFILCFSTKAQMLVFH